MLSRSSSFLLDADEAPTCNLNYIRRRLGRSDYSDRRMVTFVTQLVDQRGFPQPLPSMRKGMLTGDVTQHSSWLRPAVETWLDNFLPPEAAVALDRQAMAAAASEMDAAAAGLGLRVVGGRDA